MEMNIEQKVKGGVLRRICDTSNASNAEIPEDIQIEILLKLPSKSFSRCMFVSKHWNDTLTIQAFLVRHFRSYNKHPKLAFVLQSSVWEKESVISFELNDDNTLKTETAPLIRGQDVYFTDLRSCYSFYMSNICNDLICLFNPSSTFIGLLNLKTRDFIQLPSIITLNSLSVFGCCYALGFDPVQQVFKILNISYGTKRSNECTTPTFKAAILTVGSKYWNTIDDESLPSSVTENLGWWTTTNSLCVDGVIYLLHTKTTSNIIVAFDFNREAFRDYELPRPLFRRYYLTCVEDCPTLFTWTMQSDYKTEKVEQQTLFNHKTQNAAWKKRNFTNKFPTYGTLAPTIAGRSTLLKFSEWINSEYSWYSLYDLGKFAIE